MDDQLPSYAPQKEDKERSCLDCVGSKAPQVSEWSWVTFRVRHADVATTGCI